MCLLMGSTKSITINATSIVSLWCGVGTQCKRAWSWKVRVGVRAALHLGRARRGQRPSASGRVVYARVRAPARQIRPLFVTTARPPALDVGTGRVARQGVREGYVR